MVPVTVVSITCASNCNNWCPRVLRLVCCCCKVDEHEVSSPSEIKIVEIANQHFESKRNESRQVEYSKAEIVSDQK